MKTLLRLFLVAVVGLSTVPPVHAGAETGAEEALFGEIPTIMGTLTQESQEKSPVTVTTITADQIKMTPARNLYDVLEVYVPGFQYMTHYDSNHMGLRGLQVDRDYNWLLLVNGRLMNQRSHNGPITELGNWDMNDIEKVEVVRGPGSVTYGPGAVAGVISITTKNADTSPGTQAGVQYMAPYRSEGGYASTSFIKGSTKGYFYTSANWSEGARNPDIFLLNAPAIAGATGFVPKPTETYMDDYRNRPQFKFHAQFDLGKEWTLWARYTNGGGTMMVEGGGAVGTFPNQTGQFDPLRNIGQNEAVGTRQYTVTAENDHKFNDKLSLKSSLSYFSLDCQRVEGSTITADNFSAGNYVENYAENDLTFKSTLHFNPAETWKTALGGEFSHVTLGKGWGATDSTYIIDDGVDIYADPNEPGVPHSVKSGTTTRLYSKSFGLYNYAVLGEVSKSVTKSLEIIASGRVDKNVYSNTDFSPRLAAVYDAGDYGLTKLSLQKSVRENDLIQLYAAHALHAPKPTPEKFKGVELSYSNKAKGVHYTATGFYSDVNVLGWGTTGTVPNGRLRLAGAELEAEYKSADEKFVLGGNHSFAKQLSFGLASGINTSDISTSNNYKATYPGLGSTNPVYGHGNERLNWPDQQTKIYSTQKVNDKLKFFESLRLVWGYDGGKNWLVMLQNTAERANNAAGRRALASIDNARRNRLFSPDVRLDISMSYQVTKPLSVVLLGQNLARLTRQYRYDYMMGGVAVATVEPTTVALRADYKFGGVGEWGR